MSLLKTLNSELNVIQKENVLRYRFIDKHVKIKLTSPKSGFCEQETSVLTTSDLRGQSL